MRIIRFIFFFGSFFPAAGIFAVDYTAHIQKAVNYLNRRQGKLTGAAVITTQLLRRNYGIIIDDQAGKEKLLKKPPLALKPLLRVVDREAKLSELEISVFRGWKRIYASALHCDLYPLHWDFFNQVRKAAAAHPYDIPQSIPPLETLEWLRCDFDRDRYEKERGALLARIPEILQSAEIGTHIWVESVIALFISGKGGGISHEMIRALAAMQSKDGSWKSDDALTAKALWVLLMAEERRKTGGNKKPAIQPIPESTKVVS